jgi:GldM C-terminal domain
MKNLFSLSLFFLFSLKIYTQRAVVALEKMNVMYMGVSNPISVAVEGFEDNKVKVSIDNGSIVKNADGGYDANTARTGLAIVTIEWQGGKVEKKFRVKPLPDPLVKVSDSLNTKIYETSIFGLIAYYEGFDWEVPCSITSYTMTRTTKKGETSSAVINGSQSGEAQRLIRVAKKGDTYIYSGIKCKCSGDTSPRLLSDTITRVIKD